jgi:ABC-2 type transport system permease protein
MAGVDVTPQGGWSNAQTRAQFGAVARLRWRIFVNQFRKKGSAGEIVGRAITYVIFTGFALGLMGVAGGASWVTVSTGHLNRLDMILWGAFFVSQFMNIQVGQPGTVFDPTQLIRFPMKPGTYVGMRLFFGLLSPANVLIGLLSLSIAVGVTVAEPALWLYALIAMAVFAVVNAMFSRMIFAWVDRWLSTRRAREVLTACIFIFSLGFQYLNVKFNPAYNHHPHHALPAERIAHGIDYYNRAQPFWGPLPPGLTTSSMVAAQAGHVGLFALFTLGCAAFAVLFYGVFAWRMRVEFRGENLTDVANAVPKKAKASRVATVAAVSVAPAAQRGRFLPGTIAAVLGKELLQIRRNTGLFFGLLAPIFFVFLFAGKLAARNNSPWVFPLALVYVMMGLAPLSYNSFGLEGAGAQFYFMAPVRVRDVFFAKNLVGFLLAALDIAVTVGIIAYVAVLPDLSTLVAAILWAAGTLLLTTTLGNRRSVTTPKKIEAGRTASRQASQASALIAFGVLLGSAAVGAAILLPAMYWGKQWVLLPVFLVFAAGAFFVYRWGLGSMDGFAMEHRERLFEELCKK